jgi:hypothetical protein
MLAIGLALVVGIGIISVTWTNSLQNGHNSDNNLMTAFAATKKTVFLHQKPEANLMYNRTSHSYFSMDGKTFKCKTFFDGVIYYKANDTNYFKCVDRGSTAGRDIEYRIVP